MCRHGENIYKRKDGRYEGRYIVGKQTKGRQGLDMYTVISIWKSGANWQSIRLHYRHGL